MLRPRLLVLWAVSGHVAHGAPSYRSRQSELQPAHGAMSWPWDPPTPNQQADQEIELFQGGDSKEDTKVYDGIQCQHNPDCKEDGLPHCVILNSNYSQCISCAAADFDYECGFWKKDFLKKSEAKCGKRCKDVQADLDCHVAADCPSSPTGKTPRCLVMEDGGYSQCISCDERDFAYDCQSWDGDFLKEAEAKCDRDCAELAKTTVNDLECTSDAHCHTPTDTCVGQADGGYSQCVSCSETFFAFSCKSWGKDLLAAAEAKCNLNCAELAKSATVVDLDCTSDTDCDAPTGTCVVQADGDFAQCLSCDEKAFAYACQSWDGDFLKEAESKCDRDCAELAKTTVVDLDCSSDTDCNANANACVIQGEGDFAQCVSCDDHAFAFACRSWDADFLKAAETKCKKSCASLAKITVPDLECAKSEDCHAPTGTCVAQADGDFAQCLSCDEKAFAFACQSWDGGFLKAAEAKCDRDCAQLAKKYETKLDCASDTDCHANANTCIVQESGGFAQCISCKDRDFAFACGSWDADTLKAAESKCEKSCATLRKTLLDPLDCHSDNECYGLRKSCVIGADKSWSQCVTCEGLQYQFDCQKWKPKIKTAAALKCQRECEKFSPPAPPMPPWFAPGLDCYSHKDCANDKIRSTCVVQDSHAWALCISCDKQLFQDDCPYWSDQNVSTPDKEIEDFVTLAEEECGFKCDCPMSLRKDKNHPDWMKKCGHTLKDERFVRGHRDEASAMDSRGSADSESDSERRQPGTWEWRHREDPVA